MSSEGGRRKPDKNNNVGNSWQEGPRATCATLLKKKEGASQDSLSRFKAQRELYIAAFLINQK